MDGSSADAEMLRILLRNGDSFTYPAAPMRRDLDPKSPWMLDAYLHERWKVVSAPAFESPPSESVNHVSGRVY